MDDVLVVFNALLERFLLRYLGPGSLAHAVGSVTWLDLGAIAALLLLTALANLAVSILFRRQFHRQGGPSVPIRHHVYPALELPLYGLVSLWGLYAALVPVLLRAPDSSALSAARALLDALLEIGSIIALSWFAVRVSRALEARAVARSSANANLGLLFVPLVATATRLSIIVGAIALTLSLVEFPPRYAAGTQNVTTLALIAAITVFLSRAVNVTQHMLLSRIADAADDDLRARKIATQVHFMSRAFYAAIGVCALGAVLMMFQQVRHIGTSLLTSAGIVGILAGIAAQKPLANLFAGLQIALSQPLRENDVLVVEGEWGRVEEITLSYVVLRTWDERRLILPLIYFLEKPFQNWTREATAITGTVYLWVDYSFPVEQGRTVLKEIIEGHSLWDKRSWSVQVTDADHSGMQLRVVATAANSSNAWNLRCDIRERFIAYIQRTHPASLPRVRAELGTPSSD